MLFLSLALSYGGFTALCLSMHRHYRDLFKRAPSKTVMSGLRSSGYGLLILALLLCVDAFSPSVGAVIWLGLLSAAALLLVAFWAWRPTVATWIAVGATTASTMWLLESGVQW